MRSGNLYHRILFFAKQITRGDYGDSSDVWDYNAPTITTRGEVRYTGGTKILSNDEKFYSKSVELTVRYRSTITETMRIQIDGTNDLWMITYIEELGRKEGLRLTIEKLPDGLSIVLVDPPTGFTATLDTETNINLAWTNNADGDAVSIERSTDGIIWSEVYRTATGVVVLADTYLSESTRYFYRIRHFKYYNYSAYAAIDDATTSTYVLPLTPTGLAITELSETSLQVDWDNMGADAYQLWESATEGGVYTQLNSNLLTNTYTHTIVSGSTHWYKVRGVRNVPLLYGSFCAAVEGLSWVTYWATRFVSGLTLTIDSDTEATLNWTNNGIADYSVSIERATDMITFAEVATVGAGITTKQITGLTESTRYSFRIRAFKGSNYSTVYSNIVYDTTLSSYLDDGNTIFQFDFEDETTLTKVSDLVSQVNDISGLDHHLLQAGADAIKPKWYNIGGLYFDGADDFLKAVAFTFNRPEFLYCVIRQIRWTLNDTIFDGNANATGVLQQAIETSVLNIYAGASIHNHDLPLIKDGIVEVLFNAANSIIKIDNTADVTGNTGTANMGGLTLGCNGNTLAWANFQIKALIGRITADNSTVRTSIRNYLRKKYFPLGVWSTGTDVLNASIPADADNVYEPFVIYDNNPQILAGPNVFKMWFSGGWGTIHSYYAESDDGIVWSRYGSAVVADHSRCCMVKYNGIYYLYVHEQTTNLRIDLYTSTDGINFIADTAPCLSEGMPGAWDDQGIHNTSVIIENGIWYMFYDAYDGSYFSVGLATSPDGKIWTKYAGNPIINWGRSVGACDVHKVGDIFYMWMLGIPPGYIGLPSDLYRLKSTDLINWTLDPKRETFIRTQADEGVGLAVGQVADPCLIEYNNQVVLFYAGSSDGTLATGHQHINRSVADMPFTDLVKTNEGNQ